MSTIVAVAPVLPPHVYPQARIATEIGTLVTGDAGRAALLARLHAATGIERRHLALPLEQYRTLGPFDETNRRAGELGLELAERAVRAALQTAGLEPHDVDHLLFTTVTCVEAPSLDARLVERVGLRPDVTRWPGFGLGCAGGAAGLARAHEHLLGHPGQVVLLVSVELCSLTLQRGDDSTANLVATGLFADGGAAVVLRGAGRPVPRGATAEVRAAWLGGPQVVATRSVLYPGSSDALGWQVGASGLRIVLSGALADAVREHVGDDVKVLLSGLGAERDQVGAWLVHPGGPKILDAVQAALGLDDDALAVSRRSLAGVGNLSSAAVLHVLADTMAAAPEPGTLGVLVAFGPGVAAELVALRWPDAADAAGGGP